MKRYYVAAGALLLGTSAFAVAADFDKFDKEAVIAAKPVAMSVDKTIVVDKSDLAASSDMKLDASFDGSAQSAAFASFKDTDKLAFADESKFQTASADSFGKFDGGAKIQTASFDKLDGDTKLQTASFDKLDGDAKLQNASFDTFDKPGDAKLITASADGFEPVDKSVEPIADGVGGPEEVMVAGNAVDLTPRPATHNYPPCSPGPGDDNCIQLYEPGVRAQLAGWNAPTGGLADSSTTTAMGGPYEPVDTAKVETDPVAIAAVEPGDPGVGTPVDGYPPCTGPADDRCIQLHEPGVTVA